MLRLRAPALLAIGLGLACSRPAPEIRPADEPAAFDDAGLPGMSARQAGPLVTRRLTAHGYGCGGHCAFNTKGSSTVTLSFGDAAHVVDEGTLERGFYYPDSSDDETTTWRYVWKGSASRAEGGGRLLRLALDQAACTRRSLLRESSEEAARHPQRPRRDKDESSPCGKVEPVLVLRCTRERVTARRVVQEPGGVTEEVWRCTRPQPGPVDAEPPSGSGLPWVFGIDADVVTRYTGEPFPELLFEQGKAL